jgi:hypothetical protein
VAELLINSIKKLISFYKNPVLKLDFFIPINNFMDYLTNYYKNLSEDLQRRLNILEAQLNEVKITKIVNGKVVKYDPSEKSEEQATRESGANAERDQIVQDIEAEEGSGRYTKEYLQAKAQEKLNMRQRNNNAVRVSQNTVETGGTTRPGGESTFEQGKYSATRKARGNLQRNNQTAKACRTRGPKKQSRSVCWKKIITKIF